MKFVCFLMRRFGSLSTKLAITRARRPRRDSQDKRPKKDKQGQEKGRKEQRDI